MKPSNDTMRQAMRLMQTGNLQAATRILQHGLAGDGHAAAPAWPQSGRNEAAARGAPIDGQFRVIDGGKASPAGAPGSAGETRDAGARSTVDDSRSPGDTRDTGANCTAPRGTAPWPRAWTGAAAGPVQAQVGVGPAAWSGRRAETGDSDLPRHRFSCDAGGLDYGLYIPAGLDTAGAPLLVMLHGCTQTPEDFARGTRMNRLAAAHGYVVAWPAQAAERNQNRCWNWFRGSDQQRGRGEPAILAALSRSLVATHRLDADRVYVAGLSAGGAMAAVLANTHPDVFAAIGVHSGLPTGLASDIPSAFAAMRKGAGGAPPRSVAAAKRVPTIVFHGDGDTTVHPRNGHGVVEQCLGNGGAADDPAGARTVERDTAPGGLEWTRTVHRTADGRIAAEHWLVHGAGHAWSGGDAAGTYTDPCGPDASAQMLRFFAGCRRTAE